MTLIGIDETMMYLGYFAKFWERFQYFILIHTWLQHFSISVVIDLNYEVLINWLLWQAYKHRWAWTLYIFVCNTLETYRTKCGQTWIDRVVLWKLISHLPRNRRVYIISFLFELFVSLLTHLHYNNTKIIRLYFSDQLTFEETMVQTKSFTH